MVLKMLSELIQDRDFNKIVQDCIAVVSRKSYQTLRRLEVNADLAQGFRTFRFAELITSFKHLQKLSIHFSGIHEMH